MLSQYQNKYQPPGPKDEQVTGYTLLVYSIFGKSHSDTNISCAITALSTYVQAVPLSPQGPHASWLTDRRYKISPSEVTVHVIVR